MDLEDAGCRARYLIRDRDGKFPELFDAVLKDAGIEIVLSGVRMPRMNSIMERWVQTCGRELLDRTLIWDQRHLMHALREFEQFYERYGMRRLVKPGLTGLAQIRGYRGEIRNPRDVRGRARCDLVYLWGWCMALDLRIIFLTAWQVVRPHHNAY